MGAVAAPQPTTVRDPGSNRRTRNKVLTYAGLIALTAVFIAPLLWMLSTSLKSEQAATSLALEWIPGEPTTQGYQTITRPGTDSPVLRWFVNSLLAAAAHALLVVAVAAPAAYALARMHFRGKRTLFALILATLFIPPVILTIPNYITVDRLQWVDTIIALVVPGAAGAFGVFFLRQFFLGLPLEIEEAARVDGANAWQIFFRVVLPLSRPALATLVVLSFLTNWNDFLWPIYVMFSPERYVLPVGLATLQGAYNTNYPVIMAGAVIASVPVLILFVFAQRFIIEGVSRSGLKG